MADEDRRGQWLLAPAEGRIVLDPNDMPLGPEGRWLPKSSTYVRRVKKGDAIVLQDGDALPPPEPAELLE